MRRLPGRKPKSGSRALARHLARQTIDERTKPAKARRRAAQLLADDAGGWDYLNNRETLLVWATANLWAVLQARLDLLLAGKADTTTDDFRWIMALVNSFRRNLEVLGLRPDRVHEKLPTLASYLAGKATVAAPQAAGSTITTTVEAQAVPATDNEETTA